MIKNSLRKVNIETIVNYRKKSDIIVYTESIEEVENFLEGERITYTNFFDNNNMFLSHGQ